MGKMSPNKRAFSLLEMLAVVVIMMILLGVTAFTVAGSRSSVRVRNDAANMVSFLRNMWDQSKASGAPLVLNPNWETGRFSYMDPREGREIFSRLKGRTRVLGIRLNDRFYHAGSQMPVNENDPIFGNGPLDNAIFVSEGRGLSEIAVVFGIVDGEEIEHVAMARLNLINGKGGVDNLEPADLDDLFSQAEEAVF